MNARRVSLVLLAGVVLTAWACSRGTKTNRSDSFDPLASVEETQGPPLFEDLVDSLQ